MPRPELVLAEAPPKIQPYSIEVEMSVLGAALIDDTGSAALEMVEHLTADAFYREAHRAVFRAMAELIRTGQGIDPVTLVAQLQADGTYEQVGGHVYVMELYEAVPTAVNASYYIQRIRELYTRRRMLEFGATVQQWATQREGEVGPIVDEAGAALMTIAEGGDRRGFVTAKTLLTAEMEALEERAKTGAAITGLASGFADLDRMTAGFQPGDLAILAARPSMGKSAMMLNIAAHAAICDHRPVAIFSLEMSGQSLIQRLLSAEARVEANRIRDGRLKDEDYARLATAAGYINTAPIVVDDSPALSVMRMRAKARRYKTQRPDLGLIVVDYLQLMTGDRKTENRQQEVSEISRGLKALAKELDVPVVALSQLSRAVEQRPDKRPLMSDLRESGAIEQDADLIMFLYRPEYYFGPTDKDGNSLVGRAELIVGKQRNGATGTVNLHFRPELTRFEPLSHREER